MSDIRKATPISETLYRWHTVVIVDDDPNTLSALQRALSREPYDVVTTDRPLLALDWVRSQGVSLVISDQLMPEMDGEEFLEGVWKCAPRTGRLLLTGYPEAVGGHPGLRRRPVRLLAKPWNEVMLKKTIRELLREREGVMP